MTRLFVLDTTVLSQLTAESPDLDVVSWLEAAPGGTLCVPTNAVFEIQVGVELARRNRDTRAADFERRLDRVLADRKYRMVSPDLRAARIRARLAADPDLIHMAVRDPRSRRAAVGEKLAIAACALSLGAAVATLDRRDYSRIAKRHVMLRVFDPRAATWLTDDADPVSGIDLPRSTPSPSRAHGGIRREDPHHRTEAEASRSIAGATPR